MATVAERPGTATRQESKMQMSRLARDLRTRSVTIFNVGDDEWVIQRQYGSFIIPPRHKFEGTLRCATCGTDIDTHDDAMERLRRQRELMAQQEMTPQQRQSFNAAIKPHEFESPDEEVCRHCREDADHHDKAGRYSILRVSGQATIKDMGDNKRDEQSIFADEIAEDLIKEQGLGVLGVAVSSSELPTTAELDAQEGILFSTLRQFVTDGDREYLNSKRTDLIPAAWKRAVKRLGLQREWAGVIPERMMDCPVCKSTIKDGAAICLHCHAIINPEKARAHGIPIPPTEPPKVSDSAGRPTGKP